MTAQEIIDKLNAIKNKNLKVFFVDENYEHYSIDKIEVCDAVQYEDEIYIKITEKDL